MGKLINKKELLESIVVAEGSQFEYDEMSIVNEYKKDEENKSSLAIKLLSIFGGFMGTQAFLVFMFLLDLFESEAVLMVFGFGFVGFALILNKVINKVVIDTFSISMYILGICLIVAGFLISDFEIEPVTICIMCIAFVSLFIAQNFILSFVNVLLINAGFLVLILLYDAYNLVHLYIAVNVVALAFLVLNEAKVICANNILTRLYNPLRIGLIISLLFGLIAIGKRFLTPISQEYIWLSSIASIGVGMYLVHKIIKINQVSDVKTRAMVYVLTTLAFAPIFFAPSISGALVIILLSFLVNYKTGVVIGIIAFIYFISQYYYDLTFTLLTKSIILFTSGVLFLLLYLFITKKSKSNEKV